MLDPSPQTTPARPELDPELLRGLDPAQSHTLARARAHARLELRLPVRARPANASEREREIVAGLSVDLSRGGCRLVAVRPLRVGDVYRLEFDAPELALPATFARCLRCRLLRDDAFEAGFEFFGELDLPARLFGAPESAR